MGRRRQDRRAARVHGRRRGALAAGVAVLVGLATASAGATASATDAGAIPDFGEIDGAVTTIDTVRLQGGEQLGATSRVHLFAREGESVAVALSEGRDRPDDTVTDRARVVLSDPRGAVVLDRTFTGDAGTRFGGSWPSSATGVWTLSVTDGTNARGGIDHADLAWEVAVLSGPRTAVPGRVFSEAWSVSQPAGSVLDHTFTALNAHGARYEVAIGEYRGVQSVVSMNNVGNAEAGTATSVFRSVPLPSSPEAGGEAFWQPINASDHPDVEPFRLFLEEPAADLPNEVAAWADGRSHDRWLAPPYRPAALAELAFARGSFRSNAGTLSGTTTVPGQLEIKIDTDGDGDFAGARDVAQTVQVPSSGAFATEWDGRDAAGDPVPPTRSGLAMRVELGRTSPIHFVRSDVEDSSGGVAIRQLVGPAAGSDALSWDDGLLADTSAERYSHSHPLTGDGVSSKNGVHRWAADDTQQRTPNANDGVKGSWGDLRSIDDWTFLPEHAEAELAIAPIPPADLRIDKAVVGEPTVTDDAAAARVTWSVLVGNAGRGEAADITVTDTYPEGTDASSVQVVSEPTRGAFDPATGVWSIDRLGPDETASMTFSALVALGEGGPTAIVNRAEVDSPDDPRAPGDECQPNAGLGDDVDQCDVEVIPVQPPADLRVEKAATEAEGAGSSATITWTVQAGNVGRGRALDVVVADTYPAEIDAASVRLVDEPERGVFDAATGVWSIGTLEPGERVSLSFSGSIERQSGSAREILNRVVIDSPSDPRDPDPSDPGTSETCQRNDTLEDDRDQCDETTTTVSAAAPSLAVTGGSAPALAAVALAGGLLVGGIVLRIRARRRAARRAPLE